MYNRSDGFDTFAQSEGLEREFVERELAAVFENKLHKNDVALVRRDGMPPVYTQCCTKSGVLVQNCIRYLPLDYTGSANPCPFACAGAGAAVGSRQSACGGH